MNATPLHVSRFLLLLLLAYAFSVAVRFIWVYQFSGSPDFYWNDQIMINTNDGYAFAEGARDMMAGTCNPRDLSYCGNPLAALTALLAKVLPVSFETLILYMPAFIGSLLVVPLMLIGRTLGNDYLGFIAALLGGITHSYYNRTMTGYYDTDMLTIVLPTLVLYSLIAAATYGRNRYLLLLPLFIIANSWWYPQSYSLSLAMTGMVLLYTLIFERRNLFFYKILIFMLLSMALMAWYLKLLLALALFGAFHYLPKASTRSVIFALLAAAAALMLLTGGFAPVIAQLQGYLFRSLHADDLNLTLRYFDVVQTVREAGQIPFDVFAARISGATLTFLFALLGLGLLMWRHKVMLLALPMVGLGFIAFEAGLRFTVYAVPVMALGMGYFILFGAQLLEKFIFIDRTLHVSRILFVTLATAAALYPNIDHIVEYKVPTVFNKEEVKVLDDLGRIAGREDYVVTWWDFGYPIRYYSDVRTLIDGGKHTGKDNFATSFALTQPPLPGANMARLDVEYTERGFDTNHSDNLLTAMRDYNQSDLDAFLASLGTPEFTPPASTRDVYLYLPLRMMSIFPTVALFSNLDLRSGAAKERPFFYNTAAFKDAGAMLHLGNGIALDKGKGVIMLGQQQVPLAQFVTVAYDAQGKVQKNIQNLHANGALNLIYLKSYNQFLLLDHAVMESLYIQLFVLEQYDPALFEGVIMTPWAKVFKLKR
ncbi:MAG: peptide transporter [Campylobacterales bacterium]|nr:peptide transporter [Campylobacterales bacterium]